MKATLFALFVALLLVGCGESPKPSESVDMNETAPQKDAIETAVDYSKLQNRGGVKYLPNKETPLTGRAESFYDNGQKKLEANYKDGKEVGLTTSWYENGQKAEEENYKDGKKDGLQTKWWENGQKGSEENYKDGKLNGLEARWYDNGQKKLEANYKDGKLMSSEVWKPNGEKCPESNVKNGNGVLVWYSVDGTERGRFRFKDSEPVCD